MINRTWVSLSGALVRFLGFDRDFYRSLVALTLPAVVQFFLFHLLTLSDNWMVASLGSVAVTGVALSNKVAFILNVVIFGLSNGVAVYTAQAFSLQDHNSIRKAYVFLMVRVLCIAVLFFVPALLFSPVILRILTSDPEIIAIGVSYLTLAAISFLPMALGAGLSWLMRSFEEAKTPLYATIIAVFLNIVFNYYFMFEVGLGVVGAALGTIIARSVEFVFLFYRCQRSDLAPLLGIKAFLQGLKGITKDFKMSLYKLAIPVTFNEFSWSLSLAVLEIIYASISRTEYSAYVVSSGVAEFSYFIFHALAISCGIVLGNHAKYGKEFLAKMGSGLIRLGSLFSLVNMLLVFCLSFVAPYLFPHLDQPELIGDFLRTISIFTVFNLLVIMMNIGILRAGGDAIFAFLVDVGPQWLITIPVAFYLSTHYEVSVRQIYIMVACMEFCKFLVFFSRVKSQKWIKDILNSEGSQKGKAFH